MSYYEYDPNFYYYDDYPDFDVFTEDPVVEYQLPPRKNMHIGNISDENEFFQHKSSRYIVPVVYAPTRISDLQEYNDMEEETLQEHIDFYYNDRRNLEREAIYFQDYVQPRYCASTIQEETESSTTFVEAPILNNNMAAGSNIPMAIATSMNTMEVPEKWIEYPQKVPKLKKKKGSPNTEVPHCKKYKKRGKLPRTDESPEKLEPSNSWTTLPSSIFTTKKENKHTETIRDTNIDVPNNLPAKQSKSLVCMRLKSKPSVTCQTYDESAKNVKKTSQPKLRPEKDTDKIPNDTNMKGKFQSVSNVKSIAEGTTKPTEMVGWMNKAMKQDSSTSGSSKLSLGQPINSTDLVPASSDSTDITIDSDEYKQFIESINKPLRPQTSSDERFANTKHDCQKQRQTDGRKGEVMQKVMIGERNSSDSFFERFIRATKVVEEKQYYGKKVNPLVEVPLGITKKTMYYVPTIVMTDFPVMLKENIEQRMISRKRSLFLRIIRRLADFIASVQNFAYRYVLRYILFV